MLTFEQLSTGMYVVLHCPCGQCLPECWRVESLGIGTAIFRNVRHKHETFCAKRRPDGGLRDATWSPVRMWARGVWG
jgi:hypothetical protein